MNDIAPTLWKYLLGALIALIILIPLWTIFVMVVVQPGSLMMQEQTMSNRLLWWVAGPVVVVTLFFGVRWMAASNQVQAKEQHAQAAQAQQVAASEQSRREYVLEVIGLGVTLDKYRQGKLWEALQKGDPFVTIREQDKEKYAWSEMERSGISGGRGGDTLENGAQYTPMYYGVPVFNAQSPSFDPENMDLPNAPEMGLAGSAVSSGMAWHLFVAGPRRFDEHPDRILEDVFAFFDNNPDVPYIVLNSNDDMYFRDLFRAPGSPPLMKNGKYIPEMPDASVLLVLARRERVDPVRPFVWDDPENNFVQNVFRSMYAHLMAAVPHPRREKVIRTSAQVGADPIRQENLDGTQRQPLVSEWLEAAAAFAQRSDIRGTGTVSLLNNLNPFAHRPPTNWKPTPWFPIPWNKDQLATFDRLPTLGFIHRPTFVKFTDEHGKPITRRDERGKVLQAGWQAALLTLPEAERARAPALVVAATGDDTNQTIMLHSALNVYAAQGGPEIDTGKSGQFIDTDKRLGNTGAATLFMQMAIGVMGSYRDGGVSAAVNLRDRNEASIVFISPPSDQQRKSQKHPHGGDVFAHHGAPAVDPANYQ
ncbi:type VI lipase adapter Tla3 domain-containing protein [Janthinobacterium agaricidamnosum]|uniref:DUF2875 domain-containing protein n=1 Tax=Janthinobacterium agaricidamnosum NBRC 102515 = DSM 9628 TaxID=1349767 RepID=W0V538_9BURK|nr:DUF2875 family protein [Janthinobacterium agaricidamnosum]CDG82448.1 hypothetical protein GJA_1812 [Janthinobacterium agaricidamnosum NBRC 102515 = DSM 9628]